MKEKKIASALKYDILNDEAPILVAKGEGYVAEKIIEIAKEHDTVVYKDELLAKQLSVLETGTYIPEDLYAVVAEVLLFITNMDGKYGEK